MNGFTFTQTGKLLLAAELYSRHGRQETATRLRQLASGETPSGMETLKKRAPSWAKAIIVAELNHDDCESQSDYFNHKTSRVVALAFAKTTRENFKELRKAAGGFAETEHLGLGRDIYTARVVLLNDFYSNGSYYCKEQGSPWHSDECRTFTTEAEAKAYIEAAEVLLPMDSDGTTVQFGWNIRTESVEHRENYSMGSGNYLKAGWTHANGWRVCRYSWPCSGLDKIECEHLKK